MLAQGNYSSTSRDDHLRVPWRLKSEDINGYFTAHNGFIISMMR